MKLRFVVLGLLGLLVLKGQAQNSVEVKPPVINIGVNVPVGSEIVEVYSAGLAFELNVPVILNNFEISPSVAINYHLKYLNEAAKSRLFNVGLGIGLHYQLAEDQEGFRYLIGLKAFYETLNDKISPRSAATGSSINTLKGSGISFGPSIKLYYQRFTLNANYQIRVIPVEFDEDLIFDITNVDPLFEIFQVQEDYDFDFSSVRITVGYRL